jgi:hypothetical protein
MNTNQYKRFVAWGKVLKAMQETKALTSLNKLLLSQAKTCDYDRSIEILSSIAITQKTLREIGAELNIESESVRQMIRALVEGGLSIKEERSGKEKTYQYILGIRNGIKSLLVLKITPVVKRKTVTPPLKGAKIGHWLIVGDSPSLSKKNKVTNTSKILCRCECGTEKEVQVRYLLCGKSSSCQPCSRRFTTKNKN